MAIKSWSVVVGLVLASASARANPADWPMYGRDPSHTFATTTSAIDQHSLASLSLAWTFTPGDAVTASPTVVDGVVYVGSWDGYFYALDARTGALRWSFAFDCDAQSLPQPARCVALGFPASDPNARQGTDGGVVTSTAAVIDEVVYVGAGKTFYALRARDGHVLWKRVLCGNPDAHACASDAADPVRIFSSPAVYRGKLYVGTSVDGAAGYRGRIWALDVHDGQPAWTFEVDPALDAHGHVVRNHDGTIAAQNRGCGNVWSSAAIDDAAGNVIFTTADCQGAPTTPYHESILALDAATGSLAWTFRPIRTANTCDFDFGASANVIDLDGHRLIGAGNKNGSYYLVHAHDGSLAWSTNVVYGGSDGGFVGSTAFDGQRIYGATLYGDGEFGAAPVCDATNPNDTIIQDPSLHAFDLRTGAVAWEQTANYAASATTLSRDLVISGTLGLGAELAPAVRFFDRATGALLRELPQTGSVASAAVTVGTSLYFGTGNSYDGAGSSIQAWHVNAR